MYINTNKQNCNKFVIPDLDAKTTKNNKSTATHLGDKVPQNVCLPVPCARPAQLRGVVAGVSWSGVHLEGW